MTPYEEARKYKWLCSYCIDELFGEEPDMDWPDFLPGNCLRCKRAHLTIFTTEEI